MQWQFGNIGENNRDSHVGALPLLGMTLSIKEKPPEVPAAYLLAYSIFRIAFLGLAPLAWLMI